MPRGTGTKRPKAKGVRQVQTSRRVFETKAAIRRQLRSSARHPAHPNPVLSQFRRELVGDKASAKASGIEDPVPFRGSGMRGTSKKRRKK